MADPVKPSMAPDPNMPFSKWLEGTLDMIAEAGGDRAELGLACKIEGEVVPVIITVNVMTKEQRAVLAEIMRNANKGKH